MTSRFCALFLGGSLALALGGCGSSGGSSNASGSAAAGPIAWKATNACALLDKSVVTTTLGSAVKSTKLSAVKDEGNGFPLYSQCEYMLEDGRMLIFGAGQYTNGATLAEQVKDMRSQASMVTDKSPADFPGLGKAALWAPDLHAMYAMFGDGRYVSATLSQVDFHRKPDAVDKIQADAVAILHKAGA